ncbi:hypothetical protein C8N46_102190 [Kordia periserrulae]|uniref:Uncharacterized protein n=1 Tax=Kordia periserrulae TaxID=701523 RepID=A0A2T6C389_9FLAO|nr:hypothetical protein [Kordia periserrulae]PTX62790.1 hypothetical protein C8N46_102190 [Kordia periserrulae]
MRISLFFFCFLYVTYVSSQESDVVAVVNSLADYEVSENFEYYYLNNKSLIIPKEKIVLPQIQKRSLLLKYPDFPLQLLDTATTTSLKWNTYKIQKARFHDAAELHPKNVYNVFFVPSKISQSRLDSLQKVREPYTIYVKNNPHFSDVERWNKIYKTWKSVMKQGGEERYHFFISAPVFSENRNYARIVHQERTTCGFATVISFFKKQDSKWKRILRLDFYGPSESVNMTHGKCWVPSFDY